MTRTDRTHKFFEGECNPNLQVLNDILMTYCMYNFDLGMLNYRLFILNIHCHDITEILLKVALSTINHLKIKKKKYLGRMKMDSIIIVDLNTTERK